MMAKGTGIAGMGRMKMACGRQRNARKGVVISLDAMISLLVLFVAITMIYGMLNSMRGDPPASTQLRHLSLDMLTIMETGHYMQQPLLNPGSPTNSSALRAFLMDAPPSVCMDIEAYFNTSPTVAYTLSKEGCRRTAGEYQVAWRSFMIHRNASNFSYDEYYMVKMTSWYKEMSE